jgi:hypothetical protein
MVGTRGSHVRASLPAADREWMTQFPSISKPGSTRSADLADYDYDCDYDYGKMDSAGTPGLACPPFVAAPYLWPPPSPLPLAPHQTPDRRYSSMAHAALRPAPIARITVAPPDTMSPPANTPGLLVFNRSASATI